MEPRLVVKPNGPYVVEGDVRLLRTEILQTEHGEPYDWAEGPDFATQAGVPYELCRCGASDEKPFCDHSCDANGFDGTETADHGSIRDRREPWDGETVTLFDDRSLCTHAGFCTNLRTTVWALAEESGDERSYAEFWEMVSQCPSGRLTFAKKDAPDTDVEPELETSIGVEPNASYWLRGGVQVVSEDGTPYEVRNRQTLCRCGSSRNKPFCDGSHVHTGFSDPAMPEV